MKNKFRNVSLLVTIILIFVKHCETNRNNAIKFTIMTTNTTLKISEKELIDFELDLDSSIVYWATEEHDEMQQIEIPPFWAADIAVKYLDAHTQTNWIGSEPFTYVNGFLWEECELSSDEEKQFCLMVINGEIKPEL